MILRGADAYNTPSVGAPFLFLEMNREDIRHARIELQRILRLGQDVYPARIERKQVTKEEAEERLRRLKIAIEIIREEEARRDQKNLFGEDSKLA